MQQCSNEQFAAIVHILRHTKLASCNPFICFQGIRAVVRLELEKAAWLSAVGAVGAAVLGSLVFMPLMRRRLKNFDAQASGLPVTKDNGKFADVEEDEFQKKIDALLQPVEVDPDDKSLKARWNRFR